MSALADETAAAPPAASDPQPAPAPLADEAEPCPPDPAAPCDEAAPEICSGRPGACCSGEARLWLVTVAAVVIALDQLTKFLIVRSFAIGESVRVLGSVMSLTRRTNTGGAFGMLPERTQMLAVVSAVVIATMLVIGPALVGRSKLALVGLGLVLGGAAGNLIDRVRIGHVIDFIDFHFWPVFNFADTAITVGAILILLTVLLEGRKSDVGCRMS